MDELKLIEQLRCFQEQLGALVSDDLTDEIDENLRKLRKLIFGVDSLIYMRPQDTMFYNMLEGRYLMEPENLIAISKQLEELSYLVAAKKSDDKEKELIKRKIKNIKRELDIQ